MGSRLPLVGGIGMSLKVHRERRRPRLSLLTVVCCLLGSLAIVSTTAEGASAPSGFVEVTAFSGLAQPTVVRFSGDGRIFIAEKSGLIKVFDSLSDTSPSIFADLRTNVYNFGGGPGAVQAAASSLLGVTVAIVASSAARRAGRCR
jgi:hypothetical protein